MALEIVMPRQVRWGGFDAFTIPGPNSGVKLRAIGGTNSLAICFANDMEYSIVYSDGAWKRGSIDRVEGVFVTIDRVIHTARYLLPPGDYVLRKGDDTIANILNSLGSTLDRCFVVPTPETVAAISAAASGAGGVASAAAAISAGGAAANLLCSKAYEREMQQGLHRDRPSGEVLAAMHVASMHCQNLHSAGAAADSVTTTQDAAEDPLTAEDLAAASIGVQQGSSA